MGFLLSPKALLETSKGRSAPGEVQVYVGGRRSRTVRRGPVDEGLRERLRAALGARGAFPRAREEVAADGSLAKRLVACDEKRVSTAPSIVCNLTALSDADRPRYFALRVQVLAAIERVTDVGDGFVMHVDLDRASLVALAEWMAFERLCCPFLRFHLAIEGDGPARLELSGAEGVEEEPPRRGSPEIASARLLSPTSLGASETQT